MNDQQTLEARLEMVIERASAGSCPPKLAQALRYAIFPGGGRVRPRLALACAAANGDDDPWLSTGAAAALELIHCASLVHDDMPCFDDAESRRGKPSLHRAFGEEIALLVGDALIGLAFEELGKSGLNQPYRMARLLRILGRALGPAHGIIGGQAWESEEKIDLAVYHRAKTGALFEAAAEMGAVAAGEDGRVWREVGRAIGESYQVADDIADSFGDAELLGKDAGQDAANHAPNAVQRLGLKAAIARLDDGIARAIEAVPDCEGRGGLVVLIEKVGSRLCPPELRARIRMAGKAGAAA